MGYTNYWTNKRAFTNDEWKRVKDEYKWLKEMANVIIIDESKNDDEIIFNGNPKDEQDHETFYINKKNDKESFNFCKTARKPYDLAVWHLLYFINNETGAMKKISRDW
tara:strand:- start:206 stop:529 length:324 start_codon:yes stop_codon:yes gene_type:complete